MTLLNILVSCWFLVVGTAQGVEPACVLRPLAYERLALDDTPNAIVKMVGFEIHANVYDPKEMPVVLGAPYLAIKGKGPSCNADLPSTLIVAKLFIDQSKKYVLVEGVDWQGQGAVLVRMADCQMLWKVPYVHLRLPNRIERLPFCSDGYCFPAVMFELGPGCSLLPEKDAASGFTRQVFGADLERDGVPVESSSSIVQNYERHLRKHPRKRPY